MGSTADILEVAAFLLGLLLGSFLNVVISRVPLGKSIVTPRSHCPGCSQPIRAYDNIPLLSWILLRGRCRSCGKPISARYPLVELAAGLWFLVLALRLKLFLDYAHNIDFGLSPSIPAGVLEAASLGILGLLLIALIVIDWQHLLLPDALTLTGIFLSFLLTCSKAIFVDPSQYEVHLHGRNPLTSPGATIDKGNLLLTGPEAFIGRWLLSVLAAAAVLLFVRWLYRALRHREGMGFGDVKLLAMIAAFLGFWPAMLALFTGLLLATAYAITLLARRRAGALTRLPFGSFLGAGGLVSALCGPEIIAWYKHFL